MCKEVCEDIMVSCVSDDFDNHKLFNEQQFADIKKLADVYKEIQQKCKELDNQRDAIHAELKNIGAKHQCRRLGLGRRRFGIEECPRCQLIKKHIEESQETTIDTVKFLHLKLKQKHEEMKKDMKIVTRMLQMSDSDDE